MAKKENRFIVRKEDECSIGFASSAQVIVDKSTGVNYLYVSTGYGGGLTPLLDSSGNPIITSVN